MFVEYPAFKVFLTPLFHPFLLSFKELQRPRSETYSTQATYILFCKGVGNPLNFFPYSLLRIDKWTKINVLCSLREELGWYLLGSSLKFCDAVKEKLKTK